MLEKKKKKNLQRSDICFSIQWILCYVTAFPVTTVNKSVHDKKKKNVLMAHSTVTDFF